MRNSFVFLTLSHSAGLFVYSCMCACVEFIYYRRLSSYQAATPPLRDAFVWYFHPVKRKKKLNWNVNKVRYFIPLFNSPPQMRLIFALNAPKSVDVLNSRSCTDNITYRLSLMFPSYLMFWFFVLICGYYARDYTTLVEFNTHTHTQCWTIK